MSLWADAHISPKLCPWLRSKFALDAVHVRDLGLREAEDPDIFDHARKIEVVVFTKDQDFVDLVRRHGTPPQVLWLRCGNMSNTHLKTLLSQTLHDAIQLMQQGEPIARSAMPRSLTERVRVKHPAGRSRAEPENEENP